MPNVVDDDAVGADHPGDGEAGLDGDVSESLAEVAFEAARPGWGACRFTGFAAEVVTRLRIMSGRNALQPQRSRASDRPRRVDVAWSG